MPTRSRKPRNRANAGIDSIRPFASNKLINVIVETPKGKRNKFKFDEKLQRFCLGKVLPAGASFPYDFGFVPGTRADDGDPLDVLLLMDESAFPGCVVEARPIGVLEAEQTKDGKTERNDRLVAVASEAHTYGHMRTMKDLNRELIRELVHFFESYNEMQGGQFRLLAARGPRKAIAAIKACARTEARKK
jgi:inorganic pyrophosphatase